MNTCHDCKHNRSDEDMEPCATCIDMMDDTSAFSYSPFSKWEAQDRKPKHLWRDDGERLTLNDNDRYSFDFSEMHHPHEYTYERLMADGFLLNPPKENYET